MTGWTGASAEALPGNGTVNIKPEDGPDEFEEIDLDQLGGLGEDLDPVDPESIDASTLRAQDNLNQRYGDKAMVMVLAEDDFAGPRYGRFEHELAKYGVNVVAAWIRSGKIWRHCKKAGIGLPVSDLDRRNLAADEWQAAHDLANITTAVALPLFRRKALVEGGWNVEGGAVLTTYFMGLVAYVFPNEYRRWRKHEAPFLIAEDLPDVEHHGADPASQLDDHSRMMDAMRSLGPLRGQIVCLIDLGYEQKDIAETLDLPSPRAVEGQLHRTRNDPGTRGKVQQHG